MSKILPVLCLSVALCGCAHRTATPGITFLVPTHCHPSARLVNCDRNSPPHCKRIALTYDKNCEQLVAK
jgi:hypothetical protein